VVSRRCRNGSEKPSFVGEVPNGRVKHQKMEMGVALVADRLGVAPSTLCLVHARGLEEGDKDRPAVIILVVEGTGTGMPRVLALPITHSAPTVGGAAMEIPPTVARSAGLDAARSWVVLSEFNEFVWPGFDLRIIPGRTPATMAYGFLTPGFFGSLRDRWLALDTAGKSHTVSRGIAKLAADQTLSVKRVIDKSVTLQDIEPIVGQIGQMNSGSAGRSGRPCHSSNAIAMTRKQAATHKSKKIQPNTNIYAHPITPEGRPHDRPKTASREVGTQLGPDQS
jgi:hypothetical protein